MEPVQNKFCFLRCFLRFVMADGEDFLEQKLINCVWFSKKQHRMVDECIFDTSVFNKPAISNTTTNYSFKKSVVLHGTWIDPAPADLKQMS
jgi:hypothetical protein